MININKTIISNAVEIHSGLKTHHHDQFILSNNFNVIKTIVSNPVNPIPDDVLELSPITS